MPTSGRWIRVNEYYADHVDLSPANDAIATLESAERHLIISSLHFS